LHAHHRHHVPPELAKLAYDDHARAVKALDMMIDLYQIRQEQYDEQGLDDLGRMVAFAREMQPQGMLSGPTVMLTIAIGRLVG
jgi:hypothetical protein